MSVAFITHPDCLLHEMGEGHPERPERLLAIEAALRSLPATRLEAPVATREQLVRVHGEAYVDAIHRVAPRAGFVEIDPDTAMNPHTLPAALRAAGAAVLGAELVTGGAHPAAFCAVRPPGHQAERVRAMGFCFFNNVAVAAAHALDHHHLERVAIVDFDVHHGNGTEDIFQHDHRALMVSIFQHPFYPGSGVDGRSQRMVNVPLPAGSAGREFRAVVMDHWMPALESFAPQMIFMSAGFDAHRDDGMAMLAFMDSDYAWVTQKVRSFAQEPAQGRIVSMLEGGYDLDVLGRCAAAHIENLINW